MTSQDKSDGHDDLMTPAEVAALFRVDPKTVTRWAVAGKLHSLRTLGGHRRYRASEVHALLAQASGPEGVRASTGTAEAAF
ncbi:BldC family transcriptional regulator [Mobilicoccus massiliensis]|uniref:BldC family transcriptional regulator n=1 Tax=Mobilicoccus massiliensis TaxID=1522310 RepID=UPI00058C0BEC|nr:BldC family transcriptional regulator [Mobilicoccus massiliensis]